MLQLEGNIAWKIHDIDWWEGDALLTIGDTTLYFQLEDSFDTKHITFAEPSLESALTWLKADMQRLLDLSVKVSYK